MITIPVNIKVCDDLDFIANKQSNYSYAFRKLHASFHKIEDAKFTGALQKRFKLTEIELRSLKSDVSTKISQTKTGY